MPLYRPLRLEALRRHPEAFGAALEEEEQGGDLARMIGAPPNLTLGGFANCAPVGSAIGATVSSALGATIGSGKGALVGSAGLVVSPKRKLRHKGHVVGVYVAPEWRRTGLARALMQGLIHAARAQGLLLLTLSVTAGNEAARRLYSGVGFTVYGVEPLSLRLGDDFLDERLLALRLDRRHGDLPG